MLPFWPLAIVGVAPPDWDGIPADEELPGVDGLPGMESLPAVDGIDGMLLDDDEDDDDGIEGILLDDDDEDEDDEEDEDEEDDDDDEEGIDGMELWEDCWLADSQPARTSAVALIANNCLTDDLFMLKCPVACEHACLSSGG